MIRNKYIWFIFHEILRWFDATRFPSHTSNKNLARCTSISSVSSNISPEVHMLPYFHYIINQIPDGFIFPNFQYTFHWISTWPDVAQFPIPHPPSTLWLDVALFTISHPPTLQMAICHLSSRISSTKSLMARCCPTSSIVQGQVCA